MLGQERTAGLTVDRRDLPAGATGSTTIVGPATAPVVATGMRESAPAAVTYLRSVTATLSVAMVTEDDLLLQRVRLALDREGLVASVELAGRREADLDRLDRRPDVMLLAGTSSRALATAAHAVRRRLRDVHVLLVVGAGADFGARHLLDAGVEGIVVESDLEATLAIAVRAVCAGHLSVPRGMRHVVEMPALSHRERQILRLVASGLTNEQIAGRLYLAKSTVAGHLTALFRRLGVRSRSEAVTMILAGDESLRDSILGAADTGNAA
jgi:DNA-binding NarL/FixJ family response regulator